MAWIPRNLCQWHDAARCFGEYSFFQGKLREERQEGRNLRHKGKKGEQEKVKLEEGVLCAEDIPKLPGI